MQKFIAVKEKFQASNSAFEKLRLKGKKIKTQFEKVKKRRCDKFMPCFEHVSKQIDLDYKVIITFRYLTGHLDPDAEKNYLSELIMEKKTICNVRL